MNGLRVVTAVAACLPLVAWSAQGDLPARTSGVYLGVGAGYSQVDLETSVTDIGGNDFAYKVFAGYRFPQVWLPWDISVAIDAAYVDLGEATDDQLGAQFGLELDGFDVSAVGILPVTRYLDVFGKLGVYVWDATLTVDGATTLDEDSGSDLAYGIGLAYQTGGQWGVQAEIEGYDVLDGALSGSVSFTYQFK